MSVLVIGADGQLGSDLLRLAPGALAASRDDLDVTDAAAVHAAVGRLRPGDWVLNCAAWTDVDGAEANEAAATAVNGAGPAHLAAACADAGLALVHLSTDYVFDGAATAPIEADAVTGPRSAYGRSKLAGELAVRDLHPNGGYVVRTAWLYGSRGTNFVRTMARLEASREHVDVVCDQLGSPTWSRDLAAGVLELVRRRPAAGIYHATNSGQASWFELARAVFGELGADPQRVRPVDSAAFPRPAPRPAYSVLSSASWQRAGLTPLRAWRDALAAAFASVGGELVTAG